MTDSNTSMSRLHLPATVSAAEPWLRDRYTVLRIEAGPRWEQTKAVVVPAVGDAVTKLRTEVAPGAAQTVNRLTNEAARRSGPLRAEAASRGAATLAAVRGRISAAEIEQLHHNERGSRRRRYWFFGAAATGAVAAVGLVLWERLRAQAWVEDDAVLTALADEDAVNADGVNGAGRGEPDTSGASDAPETEASGKSNAHVAAGGSGKKH
jgi:hypothetical protein